jgi:hypothetical protein
MYTADMAGSVTAVDPMETLILRKTKQRNATIAQWKLLSPTKLSSQTIEISRFEGTYEVENQSLSNFFSILKEDKIQNGFADLMLTTSDLFGEFAFVSILTPHEQ